MKKRILRLATLITAVAGVIYMKNNPNALRTLTTEYFIIETLARAMKAEIERMEEES